MENKKCCSETRTIHLLFISVNPNLHAGVNGPSLIKPFQDSLLRVLSMFTSLSDLQVKGQPVSVSQPTLTFTLANPRLVFVSVPTQLCLYPVRPHCSDRWEAVVAVLLIFLLT